jgi:hypothetical protein
MSVVIPSKWDNIELRKFVHYCEYIDEKPESIEQRFELLYKKAMALLDISLEEAKNLTVKDQTNIAKLAKGKMPMHLKPRFKHKGVRYRPVGSRYSVVDARELSGDKYSAIKALAKKSTSENLHQILYLTCEPIKYGFKKSFPFIGWKTYDLDASQVEQGIMDFKDLPMYVANPMIVFFLTLSKRLNVLLNDYSIQKLNGMTKEMKELQADLESDMDGLQ